MCLRTTLRIIILILIATNIALGQSNVDCYQLLKQFPQFATDTTDKSREAAFFVDNKILPAINDSESSFEVRYIVSGLGSTQMKIVRCQGLNVSALGYRLFNTLQKNLPFDLNKKEKLRAFSSSLEGISVVSGPENLKLDTTFTWYNFVNELINNHIYDLPNQKKLLAISTNVADPKGYSSEGYITTTIQLKAGDKIFTRKFVGTRYPNSLKITEFEYLSNLNVLFSHLNY